MCVGAHSVMDLYNWQKKRLVKNQKSSGLSAIHITRMRPKRATELLSGGSLYWVFKGYILARQRIIDLEDILGKDNILRCAIILDHQIILTEPRSKRPFQGWRYLKINEAPRDTNLFSESDIKLPISLEKHLFELGIL